MSLSPSLSRQGWERAGVGKNSIDLVGSQWISQSWERSDVCPVALRLFLLSHTALSSSHYLIHASYIVHVNFYLK